MSSDVDFDLDEMKEIIDDFLIEADELILSLDNNFVKLENAPEELDLLNEIFRAVHTIKGTSSFLGFEQVTTLSHQMEDILNKLRKSEMVVTPTVMDVLLEGLDILKLLLGNVREGIKEEINLTDILGKLAVIIDGGGAEETESKDVAAVSETTSDEVESPSVQTSSAKSGELTASEAKTAAASRKPAKDQTIRVDVTRLDSLMNMMGELVLSRNSLVQTVGKINSDHDGETEFDGLNHSSNSISFITTELQMAVMKMRMLPIGKVFNRYPRLVRDLCRDSGKKIDLMLFGESTELDKSIIEEIGDPLVHIIRNSCDHGIESPEDRKAKGKPEKGTIKLTASQEGSNIVISIVDDGRGFDIEAIKAKAIEKGLCAAGDLEKMSRREIFNFIMQPGFSTAKKVTDVSGRGVGMDVVRTNIEKLNGMVDLESEVDIGTTITIKLPLTLAIIQGLLVEADDEVFILPLSSVHETVKTNGSQLFMVNQRPVMRLRDEVIPIINLGEILRKDRAGFQKQDKPYIVIVGLAEKKLGIGIDHFLGQEEVVIKSLGNYLGNTEGVAGATILGDGRIRLIIDLIGLFNVARGIS